MTHRITFVHAPNIRYDQNYGTLFSPLWAYTLAAHVPETWSVTIFDSVVKPLKEVDGADVFALSGINQDFDSLVETHRYLKNRFPEAQFIVGGPITWSFEQEGRLHLLEFFDHVFVLDGEKFLPLFLDRIVAGEINEKIIHAERFPMDQARSARLDLMEDASGQYYGAVVEVSRGCPFLCEFCDIRVLPGNNRANNKSPALIVEEMDAYYRRGIHQFQFACDNFIGEIAWARECVDAIIKWKQETGAEISLFTWLTINLYKIPDLMERMRLAGFSILFIGIESVNHNSLLETAKAQNTTALGEAVETIQSYGFVIAPGFIFGFDCDTEDVFDETLDFMVRTGIIGGDPSFLMALPGTPLFRRMKASGRLIEGEYSPTVREKITTNIRYLMDADVLARGFTEFVHRYTDPSYQLARFRRHVETLRDRGVFINHEGRGYGSPREYVKMQLRNASNRKMLTDRILFLLRNPANFIAALRGWFLFRRHARRLRGLSVRFNYWLYAWTNLALKYRDLKPTDFLLHSVDADFDVNLLISEAGPESALSRETKLKGDAKDAHQARYTHSALKTLVESRNRSEKPTNPDL